MALPPRDPRFLPRYRKPLAFAAGPADVPDLAAARAAAAARHERKMGAVVELDLDECKLSNGTTNEFGTCNATGAPCHQTFGTCKSKPDYRRGTHIWKFCSRGMPLPAGQPMRPYLDGVTIAPSEIDPAKGLAIRSQTSLVMVDEPCLDTEGDPYFALRPPVVNGISATVYFDLMRAALADLIGTAAITVTRAGATATRVNAAGLIETVAADTPRFYFDPVTLACKGLLIEEARTNLATWSQDVSQLPPWNYSWNGVASTVTLNDRISPDGGVNAAKVVTNGSNEGIYHRSFALPTANQQYTCSIYIYVVAAVTAQLTMSHSGGTAWTSVASSNVDLVAGWNRVSIVRTAAAIVTATSVTFTVSFLNSGTVFWPWGFNYELSGSATSYIPTTSASVTRNADVPSITSIAGFYNAAASTFVAEWEGLPGNSAPVGNGRIVAVDGGGGSKTPIAYNFAGASGPVTTYDGITAVQTSNAYTTGTVARAAAAYATTNDVAISLGGSTVATGTAASFGTPTAIYLGHQAGTLQFNGYLRRFTYYPVRLANADLQRLSAPVVPVAQGTFWTRLVARTKNSPGRFARLRRGFVTEPWSWDTFQTELYIIESIKGPDRQGKFTVILSDAVRLLDSTQLPAATDGKLAADCPATSNTGQALAATSSTIQLAVKASAVDGAYVGQEVRITGGLGLDQRRVITAYVGLTRIASVAAWATVPDSSSFYEVAPLSFTLTAAGKETQYPNPAVSGTPQWVAIGDEVIRYTSRVGNVLSWPDGTYRAQFGTTRDDHRADDGVQLCWVRIDAPAYQVVTDLHTDGGVPLKYVDTAGLRAEDDTWLGTAARLTFCLPKPEKSSGLLTELLADLNMLEWWDPVAQLVKFKANMPELTAGGNVLTDDNFLRDQTATEPQVTERITRAILNYNLRAATANVAEAKNFLRTELRIDGAAESPDEYGDVRPGERFSRFLTNANGSFVTARVARRLGSFRDAPIKLKFRLDPRDQVNLGDLRDVQTRALTDENGAPVATRVRVTKKRDMLTYQDIEARTTNLGSRFGFIAPAGFPDYDAATMAQRQYAFIANAAGFMTDGTAAYLIS